MQLDFPLARLGDHVDACLGKMLDVNKNKGEFQPYLGNSNVRWGSFDLTDLSKMRFEPHEDGRYGILPGDLIVCEGGEPGRCAVWEGKVSTMKIQKALHRIRVKPTLNNYYLYYWFCHAGRSGLLEPYFTGTTIKHLTGKAIAELKVPLPDVRVQDAMVDVLRRMDECIESLRETNTTLEAIAQAIFKSWFIDFDPVKAKSEGRTPDGIDADTAALFPDSFEESALGAIPKGWRAGKFGDLARLAKGTINPLKEPDREFDHYSLPAFDNGARPVQERGGLIKSNKTPFFPGAVLQSKLNPHIPRVWFAPGVSESAVCSTEFLPWVATQGSCNELIYCLLCSDEFSRQVQTLVNGTSNSHQRIKPDLVAGMSVVISDNAVVRAFEEVAAPLMEQVKANIEEAATLAELRDTLLPRLISGKLKLPELQEVAEAL